MLFAAVNLARFLKVDPEIALKRANAKFAKRFRIMERLAAESQRKIESVSREELEALWDLAKRNEQDSAVKAKVTRRAND